MLPPLTWPSTRKLRKVRPLLALPIKMPELPPALTVAPDKRRSLMIAPLPVLLKKPALDVPVVPKLSWLMVWPRPAKVPL